MFAYELHLDRGADLRRQADEWRLAEEARAAGATERRAAGSARRTHGRTVPSRGQDADGAASPRAVGTGRMHHVFHPHSAA